MTEREPVTRLQIIETLARDHDMTVTKSQLNTALQALNVASVGTVNLPCKTGPIRRYTIYPPGTTELVREYRTRLRTSEEREWNERRPPERKPERVTSQPPTEPCECGKPAIIGCRCVACQREHATPYVTAGWPE